MNQVLSITVRRFNMSDASNDKYIQIAASSRDEVTDKQFQKLKKVIITHLESIKATLIDPYTGVTEEGESDGFEGEREEAYNEVMEKVEAATIPKQLILYVEINDGLDVNTDEPIYSGIEIAFHKLDSL